ncbi:MAG: hypothetical protein KDD12_19520, partial [Lewinella sp.]|nr:hypothetical protein [Lewinella sp.]
MQIGEVRFCYTKGRLPLSMVEYFIAERPWYGKTANLPISQWFSWLARVFSEFCVKRIFSTRS